MVEESDTFVFYAPVYTIRATTDYDLIRETAGTKPTKENIGWIRLGFSKSSMKKNEERIVVRGVYLAAIFITVSGILAYFLINAATRPLSRIVKIAEDIAHGDLSQEIRVERQMKSALWLRLFK